MYYFLTIFLVICLFFLIFFHWRKKKILCKIRCMSACYKVHLLNELAEPFGYQYRPSQDIFTNHTDAWQKNYGYGQLYDQMAPYFNMVFDFLPVYFDYQEKTWLVEFWKGQYGINTGSEAGVYRADTLLDPSARKHTIFHAVDKEDYLKFSMDLYDSRHYLAGLTAPTWWLTLFYMGRFSSPKNLAMDISIQFPNFEMQNAFLDGLAEAGYNIAAVKLYDLGIRFTFCHSITKYSFLKRQYCHYVQLKNRFLCHLYCFVTRPFYNNCDKLLYLYYYLPFAFRRILRPRRFRRKKERI